MTKLGHLPEFEKPHVSQPIIDRIDQIAPAALTELVGYLSTSPLEVNADAIQGLGGKVTAGANTQTPGAVPTVNIAHGLETIPSGFTAQPANANARGAPAYHLTVDADNIILNFAANLTAATSYTWVWTAVL